MEGKLAGGGHADHQMITYWWGSAGAIVPVVWVEHVRRAIRIFVPPGPIWYCQTSIEKLEYYTILRRPLCDFENHILPAICSIGVRDHLGGIGAWEVLS